MNLRNAYNKLDFEKFVFQRVSSTALIDFFVIRVVKSNHQTYLIFSVTRHRHKYRVYREQMQLLLMQRKCACVLLYCLQNKWGAVCIFVLCTHRIFVTTDRKYQTCPIIELYDTNNKKSQIIHRILGKFCRSNLP